LKTITAKHLALAGQSLGFVIALLPHIKNDIESQLPAKQKMLANDFDRVLTVNSGITVTE
jgi:vacuolar protein sorting-associated protein 54